MQKCVQIDVTECVLQSEWIVSDDGDLGTYLDFQIVFCEKFPFKNIFTICGTSLYLLKADLHSQHLRCLLYARSCYCHQPQAHQRALVPRLSSLQSATQKSKLNLTFTHRKSFTFNPQIFTENLLCCQAQR